MLAVLLGALALSAGPSSSRSWAGPDQDRCRELQRQAVLKIAAAERTKKAALALEAVELLQTGLRYCPADVDLRFWLAIAYVTAGEEDRSRAALGELDKSIRALAQDGGAQNGDPRRDLRSLYIQLLIADAFGKRVTATLDLVARLHNQSPDYFAGSVAEIEWRTRLAYANQLSRKKDYIGASRQIDLALLAAGDNAARRDVALRNQAQVFRFDEKFQASEETFRDLAKRYPRDAVLRYALASVVADQHRFEEAIGLWKEVLALVAAPDTVSPSEKDQLEDAPMRYGVSLAWGGQVEEGRKQILAYLDNHPTDARAWYFRGVIAAEHADPPDFAEAARCLEQALKLDPFCERTPRKLLEIYTLQQPNPARAAYLEQWLHSEAEMAKRKAEYDRRRETRPDASDGCD